MTSSEPILQTPSQAAGLTAFASPVIAAISWSPRLNDKHPINHESIESRRSASSSRRMSVGRRIYFYLGEPILRLMFRLLTATYRIEAVIGAEHIDPFIGSDRICTPCYWHQQHVLCASLIRQWIRRGFKACFLISASVDGEVPERVARAWGAEVIRGSANQSSRSGTLALRDMQRMMKRGYSVVTTADGPLGPMYELKLGAILSSRIGAAPIIPIACAASRAWYLNRWDKCMIPKPFCRVVLAVGEPYVVPPDVRLDALEEHRLHVQQTVMSMMRESEDRLHAG